MMRYLKPCIFAAAVAVLATPALERQTSRLLLGSLVFLAAFLAADAWLERRRRARETRRHQDHLTEVLRQGKQLAEDASQARAEFLASMSHEIRGRSSRSPRSAADSQRER